MIFEKRLLARARGAGFLPKLWSIPWSFVLLLCAVATVGYVALYSAGGGAAEPYAGRHAIRFGFGMVLMLSIAMVDIRIIARFAWLGWLGGGGIAGPGAAAREHRQRRAALD